MQNNDEFMVFPDKKLMQKYHVAMSNALMKALANADLSINSWRVLLTAIALVDTNQSKIYAYEIGGAELATLLEIDKYNLYGDIKIIVDELGKLTVKVDTEDIYASTHVFNSFMFDKKCQKFYMKIETKLAGHIINLFRDYTSPLWKNMIGLKLQSSVKLWMFLMSRSCGGKKEIKEMLTIEELREATGTLNKYKNNGDWEKYVLARAIKDIELNCHVIVSYIPIKKSGSIIGYKIKLLKSARKIGKVGITT